MRPDTIKILGICPGTKKIGVAVLYGSSLRERCVKNFTGVFSEEKLQKITYRISYIIDLYGVSEIALKSIRTTEQDNIKKVVEVIKEIAKEKGLTIHYYSHTELKELYSFKNKMELAESITNKYPTLHRELGKEKMNLNTHYEKLFIAVATASALFKRLDVNPTGW